MIDKPLYGNPLAGGGSLDMGKYVGNPNFNVSPPGTLNVTPPSVPVSEQTPLPGLPDKNNFIDDMRDKTLPTLMFAEGTGPLQPSPPSIFPFPGMDSTEVASAETNPYNRVGQQLTGPNQDDILGTLKNIEQGIASLGQGGMNQSSFGGFNNNFGIGSFFPPYGGMYG